MKIVDVDKLRYLVANVNFEVPKTRWISNFSYSMTMAKADMETKNPLSKKCYPQGSPPPPSLPKKNDSGDSQFEFE
ncbi:hypothetical protein Goshw_025024 [Gossypium schwendimanii]|uniref:Uncharacterized protein n=1 Tax=Gossypium schwendimanii TaxID=34291 RepID=A0A7J9KUF4_GOSSC|nr:hypothetical protein [Gossypium schwendimanii]